MRDRHQRGMRGMLAPPNCVVGQVLRQQRPTLPTPVFFRCVDESIDAIDAAVPDALDHVDIGVEEVPDPAALWSSHMPLAVTMEPTQTQLAQIVLYRRPIELRADTKDQLRRLVFVTLVEQVAIATGIAVSALDPSNIRGE